MSTRLAWKSDLYTAKIRPHSLQNWLLHNQIDRELPILSSLPHNTEFKSSPVKTTKTPPSLSFIKPTTAQNSLVSPFLNLNNGKNLCHSGLISVTHRYPPVTNPPTKRPRTSLSPSGEANIPTQWSGVRQAIQPIRYKTHTYGPPTLYPGSQALGVREVWQR